MNDALESRSELERIALPALVALALGACHAHDDSASEGPVTPPVTSNLGAAVRALFGTGGLDVAYVSEADQGGLDLNGDGDADDLVAHLLDAARGTLVNTGLAVSFRHDVRGEVVFDWPACTPEIVAFPVDEEAQGADLNGDGDRTDVLAFVADRATGTVVDLEIGYGTPVMGPRSTDPHNRAEGHRLALVTTDSPGGARRLVVYDARDGRLRSTTLFGDAILALVDGWVYSTVPEGPGLDLNADGDTQDLVLVAFDAATGAHRVSGLAVAGTVVTAGTALGVLVSEDAQGAQDLNGNGTTNDLVFHVVDASSGVIHDTGLAVERRWRVASAEGRFLVPASESAAQMDWNADGDRGDHVVHVVDPANGSLPVDTGQAVGPFELAVAGSGNWLAFSTDEDAQGLDLDGDGLRTERVMQLHDLRDGSIVNTGLARTLPAGVTGHLLLSTFGVGGREIALHDWNLGDEVLRDTRVAGSFLSVESRFALLAVPEGAQRADLNEDGDEEDVGLALFDARGGTVHPLGLAIVASDALVGSASVLVRESDQGQDLNGDGDLADLVLHAVGLDR